MLAANPQEQAQYWDTTWNGRINDDGVQMNIEKMSYLLEELANRPFHRTAKVLDVGCGTGLHAHYLMQTVWPELDWTGIDLSLVAVTKAQHYGLNAENKSLYDMDGEFTAFWFLDVLEHVDDHDKAAEAVKRLGKKPFRIFGNIPLYSTTDHACKNCERPMDVSALARFLKSCGMDEFWQKIYGCYGHPYMVFEAV